MNEDKNINAIPSLGTFIIEDNDGMYIY